LDSRSDISRSNLLEPGSGVSRLRLLPPWDMYVMAVCLFLGYILIPLLVSNVLILINPFMELGTKLFVEQGVTLLTWASIFLFLQWGYGSLRQHLGLTFTRPLRYYIWETVKLVLLTFGLTLLMNYIWQWMGTAEGVDPFRGYNQADLIVLLLFAVLMAPVLEELIFRGFVQSTFHKISPPIRSVIFTSLVFLMMHASYFENVRALAQVLVLGLCFGIWRERTQSLIPGMVAHLLNNILASVLLYFAHQHASAVS
jgi:membrane protease YdiL (CAAX protease family)